MASRSARPGSDSPVELWRAPDRFDHERIRAVGIYCSDGRYGLQCDAFLHGPLALPRYDRLAVPGGAAALAGHLSAWRTADALREQIRFLVDVHDLERVILIAHHQCAFYRRTLHVPEPDVRVQQERDLRSAAEAVRSISTRLSVDAYFAALEGDVVTMLAVET